VVEHVPHRAVSGGQRLRLDPGGLDHRVPVVRRAPAEPQRVLGADQRSQPALTVLAGHVRVAVRHQRGDPGRVQGEQQPGQPAARVTGQVRGDHPRPRQPGRRGAGEHLGQRQRAGADHGGVRPGELEQPPP